MAEAAVKYEAEGQEEGKPEKNEVKENANRREIKVILLGKSGVGKTSLFLRIKDGKFYNDTRNIMTTDQGIKKTIQAGNEQVEITLYDSAAGMEFHERTLTRNYYRDSCIALLVYNADNIDSVTRLVNYIAQVNDYAPEATKIVIRNKIDLEDQTVGEHEVSASITAKGYKLSTIKHFCSTSALTPSGIDDLLLEIGKIIFERRISTETQINRFNSFRAQQPSHPAPSQSYCC